MSDSAVPQSPCSSPLDCSISADSLNDSIQSVESEEETNTAAIDRPIVLSIEGNIGSGKSTLLEYIRSCHPEWNIIPEPLEEWLNHKDENGKNILQLFYENPTKYASPFQTFACQTRAKLVKHTLANPNGLSNIFISERCLHTDRHVFASLMHADGHINDEQWKEYIVLYEQLTDELPVDGIVYVNTRAEECFKRIAKRGRKEESGIEFKYLMSLQDRHDKWMVWARAEAKPFIEIQSEKSELETIRQFIRDIQAARITKA